VGVLCQKVAHLLERGGVFQYGSDVLKEDSRLGKIGDVANQRSGQEFGHTAAQDTRGSQDVWVMVDGVGV
jgi:hypothetical protein